MWLECRVLNAALLNLINYSWIWQYNLLHVLYLAIKGAASVVVLPVLLKECGGGEAVIKICSVRYILEILTSMWHFMSMFLFDILKQDANILLCNVGSIEIEIKYSDWKIGVLCRRSNVWRMKALHQIVRHKVTLDLLNTIWRTLWLCVFQLLVCSFNIRMFMFRRMNPLMRQVLSQYCQCLWAQASFLILTLCT